MINLFFASIIKLVLLQFMVSWFVFIRSSTFSNSLFTNYCNSISDLLDSSRFASSVNSITLELLAEEKSFIYVRNNRGPSVEPWGTPQFIS